MIRPFLPILAPLWMYLMRQEPLAPAQLSWDALLTAVFIPFVWVHARDLMRYVSSQA